MKNNYLDSKLITIKGLVQGVGFRPFIYRLAKEMHIYGWVRNNNESVEIFIEADENIVNNFVKKIYSEKPITSSISSLEIKEVSFHGFDNFQIIESNDNTNNVTQVSPDIAVCEECLQDLKNNSNRINYPLINCSVCGPRYTIVKSLPYDRINTTMSAFKMCKQCYEEYSNPSNRRFHAQPIGCNHCGPQYSLKIYNKDTNDYKSIDNFNDIFKYISDGLKKNKIFCFKATGGYNLVCDAKNEESVDILRHIKNRDSKPFAVMFRDINTLKNYAKVDEIEFQQLISWQRPIVILKEQEPLAYSVSMGLGTIGAILPYMPFHYLLFEYSEMEALVMTSGNISDEPITIDDNKALSLFGKITDGVLLYNRDIYNRVDDSVVFVCNSTPYFIRRSRGFVPTPINLNIDCEGVFAAGAELTSCFSIGKGNEAILSPYIGDLKNFETYLFYDEVFKRYSHLFRFKPSFVAVDLHPNYHSTIYGTEIGVDTISVQHHYAHILSVMAEHNIVEPIIGVAFDGTGLGTDDKIWGSEFMVCTPYDFKRIGHFDYIPLPGGDKVVYEPWRTGVSLLYKIFGEKFLDFDIPINKKIGRQQIENIIIKEVIK